MKLLYIYLFIFCSLLFSQSRHTDSLALVALYNSTNGENWTEPTWTLTDSLEAWSGLTFWNGRVRTIYLQSRNLEGSIPPELGTLSDLRTINLSGNLLSGSLPAELGSMSSLQRLKLNQNLLSGQIPPELGNLAALRELILYQNQFSDSIPSELGNLIELRFILLQDNFITDISAIEHMQNEHLTTIYIGNNKLVDIPDLTAVPNLSVLSIEENQLDFADIEPNLSINQIFYNPMDTLGNDTVIHFSDGESKWLFFPVDGSDNNYQWKKNGNIIDGATADSLYVTEWGDYALDITSNVLHGNSPIDLTLSSRLFRLKDDTPKVLPDFASIEELIVDEDAINTEFDLSNAFTDPDNEDSLITFSVNSSADSLVNVSVVNNILILDYQENMFGSADVTITANSNGLTVSKVLVVTIRPVDDSPTVQPDFASIEELVVDEDAVNTEFNLIHAFTDVDNEDSLMTFSVSSSSDSIVNATVNGTILILDYQQNKFGTSTISITATSNGKDVTTDLLVRVRPIDDPPILLNSLEDLELVVDEDSENTEFDLTTVFAVVDNDSSLIITASSSADSVVSVSVVDNILILNYQENMNGTSTISLQASSSGQSTSTSFTVTVNPVDDAPHILLPLVDVNLNSDIDKLNIDISQLFVDIDNNSDELAISVVLQSDNPSIAVNIDNNFLTLTVVSEHAGVDTVIVKTNSNSFFISDTMLVTIIDKSAPNMKSEIIYSSVEGLERYLSIYSFNNEKLIKNPELSVNGKQITNEGVLFDEENNGYQFKYLIEELGQQNVEIKSTDIFGNTGIDSMKVNVVKSEKSKTSIIDLESNLTVKILPSSFANESYIFANKIDFQNEDEYKSVNGNDLVKVSDVYKIESNKSMTGSINLSFTIKKYHYSNSEQKKIGLYKYISGTNTWKYLHGFGKNNIVHANISEIGTLAFFYNKKHTLLPETVEVYTNYPNPFNPVTTIPFSLPEKQNVTLTIYNILGQKVRTLVNKVLNAGSHQYKWNGKNDNGKQLSSGVYLYEIITNKLKITKKMILIK